VSSEAGYDFLEFRIDGNLVDSWSGEEPWEEVSYVVFGGEHTFEWRYAKDEIISDGADAAWVDFVVLPEFEAASGMNGAVDRPALQVVPNPASGPVQVLVVGDGPALPWFRERLPHAVFTGFLDREDLARHYASADAFLYPSLTMLTLGLAIAIERFIFLRKTRAENRKMWEQVLPLLQKGQFKEVHAMTSASDSAIGKIVSNGLERMKSARRREDIDHAMEEGMMEIVPRLEKRTHYIATFANTITLVGLLGTIIGLIKGFTAVASVNPAEKAEMLSASISVAMNNTAFALMVAIPFLLIHAFLQARASEIVDSLEAAKITFLNLVQRLAGEQLSTKEQRAS
jgi:biopolymer transport protein ExbB/TolQ